LHLTDIDIILQNDDVTDHVMCKLCTADICHIRRVIDQVRISQTL